jgi:cytochrome subunit of sulfide dehydrogenase
MYDRQRLRYARPKAPAFSGDQEKNAMIRIVLAAGLAALAVVVQAQQPAPPPPAFAPSNLTPLGVRALAANCAACHGTNGRAAPGSTLAGLAGKPKDELLTAMSQFKSGKKPATLMHQISKGYTDAEIEALADYFSRQPR